MRIAILSVVGALGLASSALAAPKCKQPKALSERAKVTCAQAQKTALGRVKGKVKEGELEEENGKLVFSFDIAVPGKKGIEEVQVDAVTGEIVSQEHETAAHEADEAKQEKHEAKH